MDVRAKHQDSKDDIDGGTDRDVRAKHQDSKDDIDGGTCMDIRTSIRTARTTLLEEHIGTYIRHRRRNKHGRKG